MKLIAVIGFLFLSACTGAPKKNSKAEFLNQPWDGKSTADQIEKDLSRDFFGYASGNPFTAKVVFYSDALVVAKETELGRKNMDTESQIKKKIAEGRSNFIDNKTCFHVTLEGQSIETTKFSNWRAKIKLKSDELIEANYRNVVGVQSVPSVLSVSQYGTSWINNSYVCSDSKIDASQTFSFILLPQLEGLKPAEFTWVVGSTNKP